MDGFVQQLQQQKEMLKQAYVKTGALPSVAEQSMISKQLGEQFDARLRKAEQLNLKLSEEHSALKAKISELEGKLQQTRGTGGFDDLLSKVFDDADRTMIIQPSSQRNIPSRGFGLANETMMDLNFGEDQESDFQFRIGVLESDTQQAQTENNRLVEAVLELKKSLREKQSYNKDKISTEILGQEITDLKRQIQVQDEEINKLENDVEQVKSKISQGPNSAPMRASTYVGEGIGVHSFQELKRLELEVERKRIDIDSTRQRIDSKEAQIHQERVRRNNERAQALLKLDKENSEAAELRNKAASLKKQIADLESAAAASRYNQPSSADHRPATGSTASQIADLTRKNDVLLVELQRLSQLQKTQRQQIQQLSAAANSPQGLNHTLDMSAIDARQQSFNQSAFDPFR